MSDVNSNVSVDFAKARENMVECQVKPGGVRDTKIWDVLDAIPRQAFVPDDLKNVAYIDKDIEFGSCRLIAPLTFALLAELAEIEADDLILDIACGTGYSTAVLAALGGTVVGIEQNAELVAQGTQILQNLDIDNGLIVNAPHADGQAQQGPYNVIFINGFIPEIPLKLIDQLAENGRLVCVTDNKGAACGVRVRKQKNSVSRHHGFEISTGAVPGFEKQAGFTF